MEVEAQVAHFLRFSPAVLSAARGARSNSGIRHRWPPALLLPPCPDTQCAHPCHSTFRSAFLRDCPARRPRRRDGH
eukprot:4308167-Prymnesium_polylepis.1